MLQWPLQPSLMAVLNVTPDSFWQESRALNDDHAVRSFRHLLLQQVPIIDVGGESTRPNAVPVGIAKEQRRLEPILHYWHAHRHDFPHTLLSIDTYNASTADKALTHGAHIINDVYGLQKDAQMADVIAQHKALVCVMHGAQQPVLHDQCPLDAVRRSWQISANIAIKAGINAHHIAFDIGIGFGKTDAQLWYLLRHLNVLVREVAPAPVLVGASRKSFLERLLGSKPVNERLPATLACHLLALQHGARMIRAHDVEAHQDVLQVYHAMQTGANNSTPTPCA